MVNYSYLALLCIKKTGSDKPSMSYIIKRKNIYFIADLEFQLKCEFKEVELKWTEINIHIIELEKQSLSRHKSLFWTF